MRRVVVYLATSLDGFIADRNGSVDWMFTDVDFGFDAFYSRVDAVLLGRKTFNQVMSFGGDYPYVDKPSYIFTSKPPQERHSHAQFINQDPVTFVRTLQERPGKHIWVVGGATIIHQFAKHDMVDEWILTVHPILLGKGVPMLPPGMSRTDLALREVHQFERSLVQLSYERAIPHD